VSSSTASARVWSRWVFIIERISWRGHACRSREEMKSAIWCALAYQRLLASSTPAWSPALAAWRTSTAIVMWSWSSAARWLPVLVPKYVANPSPMSRWLRSSRCAVASKPADPSAKVTIASRVQATCCSQS
jgi:hypothetical protein